MANTSTSRRPSAAAMQPHTELPPVPVRSMTAAVPALSPGKKTGMHPPGEDPSLPATPHQLMPQASLRAHKAQFLMQQMLARGMSNQMSTATVLPLQFDTDTLSDMMAMQMAVVNRLQQQQRDLAQGLTEIMQDYAQLRLANTLSKFVEQEYNLSAQIGALMTSQVSQFVNLMENVQVDYGYWISLKAHRAPSPGA